MKINLMQLCQEYNFEKLFAKKGYAYFKKGYYNMNIIGIRANKNKKVTNEFDDVIVVIYNTCEGLKRRLYAITTEPGKSSMLNPKNSKGCAILVPGQYRGCWKIGLHKGKYKALCQCKPLKVYRDNNKNLIYDCEPTKVEEGIFGINIHKAGNDSNLVDNWSAGCQVFKKANEFNNFMTVCAKQVATGVGESFTYTLLDEKELY